MFRFIAILPLVFYSPKYDSSVGFTYEDGFYLTSACSETDKPMPVLLMGGVKKVCIPVKPFVLFSSVISVGGLVNLPERNQSAFRMVLSEDAVQQFRKISSQLPAQEYAFVFNGDVAFIFFIDVSKFNQIIEVKGGLNSKEIRTLHQQLERALASR